MNTPANFKAENNLIRLHGDLLMSNAKELAQQGNDFIQNTDGDILIDLSQVQKISTVSVALLLEWIRTAHTHKRHLKIQSAPKKLLDIIAFSDLDELFSEHLIKNNSN